MDTIGTDPLTRIRNRIDALDADIHRLLIERSAIIDELIRIKGTSTPGAAFRPGREADMMRRIVMRHEGRLPLTSVEHIWREIITVFTAMQAPFSVVAGPADDTLAMRDMVRFYFGFSIAIDTVDTEAAALEMLAGRENRLAALSLRAQTPWWRLLEDEKGPKIFARFPFLLTPERRDVEPVYIAGPPLQDQSEPDICLYSLTAQDGALGAAMERLGGAVVLRSADAALVEMPAASTLDELAEEFSNTGGTLEAARRVGGFAEPIEIFSGDRA
jgi:chorismate mutase